MADTTSLSRGMHPNSEMTAVGYIMAGVLLVLLLPLAPLLLLYLLIDRLGSGAESEDDRGRAAEQPPTTNRSAEPDGPGEHRSTRAAASSESGATRSPEPDDRGAPTDD